MEKRLLAKIKHNDQIYVFALLGLVLILFPDQIASYAPYIVGTALIVYSVFDTIMDLRFPDAEISLGDSIIRGIIGVILLLETEQAIAIMGIVWAVFSLDDAAKEINDFYKTKQFRIIGAVGILLTIIFSAMLMLDPFGHLAFHIRVLGLEMIAETFIKRRGE
jgi:uncharacterized membrane protein HdeD (DUF308 family)